MLTKSDLKTIKSIVDDSSKETVSALTKLVVRTSQTLQNELPTKDEFQAKTDEILQEIKAIRESESEVETLKTKVDRLEKIVVPQQ